MLHIRMCKLEMDDVRCPHLKRNMIYYSLFYFIFYCKSISAHGWSLINQPLNHTVYLSTFLGAALGLSRSLSPSIHLCH